jgi:hypothetical protein
LAIIDHRTVVSADDWELSAVIMAKSDQTRGGMIESAKQAARAKVRDRAIGQAVFDETVDRHRLDTVRRRVLRVLTDGRISRGELRARMGKREYRELLEAATAELAAEGAIRALDAPQGGVQFELNPQFSPEPQFNPQNSRPEALNQEFSPEPFAGDTDAKNPSSNKSDAPSPQSDTDRMDTTKMPKPTTCRVCYITLPAAASTDVCDDCDGASPRRQTEPVQPRPRFRVHRGDRIPDELIWRPEAHPANKENRA